MDLFKGLKNIQSTFIRVDENKTIFLGGPCVEIVT